MAARSPDLQTRLEKKKEARHRYNQEYTKAHVDELRAYRQKNAARRQETVRAWRAKNPEKARLIARRSRHKHAKKRSLEKKVYRQEHLEAIKAREKIYYRNNVEKFLARNAIRRALIANAPINDFTAMQWRQMQDIYGHRCVYCHKRRKGKLTQDHVVPLSKGGSHTWGNIVPSCASCNSSKQAGPPPIPVQLAFSIASSSHVAASSSPK
jgi:5-methylcytosine-specific restriction endonuclease McrA